jgi:hypothetical protein
MALLEDINPNRQFCVTPTPVPERTADTLYIETPQGVYFEVSTDVMTDDETRYPAQQTFGPYKDVHAAIDARTRCYVCDTDED